MADRYEELLPFYVAGTLDAAQRTALEKHLDGCDTCRRSLSEWYVIGDSVRAEADSWARTLPLPRYNGQFGTAPPVGQMTMRRKPQSTWAIATMAASFIAVILLGALVVFMASRLRPNDDSARPNPTGVADNSAIAATQTAFAAIKSPTPFDLGIIVPTITITPTFVITFEPTRTPSPLPYGGGGVGGGGGGIDAQGTQSALVAPEVFTTPIFGCMVRAKGPNPANIFREPSSSGEVVDHLGTTDWLAVFVTSNGWYELLAPNINLLGWVWVGDVQLVGADCATLPQPSPTMSATFPSCTALAVTSLLLRPDPYTGSPVTARISSGAMVGVLTLSDNGWYMVQAVDSSTGWTPVESVSLNGDCTNLSYTSGYLGSQTPLPTPSPLPTSSP